MFKQIYTDGIVVEFEGKFWGIQYEDGQVTEYGYGPLENVRIGNPKYVESPTDFTYKESPQFKDLQKGTLRLICKTTTWNILKGDTNG